MKGFSGSSTTKIWKNKKTLPLSAFQKKKPLPLSANGYAYVHENKYRYNNKNNNKTTYQTMLG